MKRASKQKETNLNNNQINFINGGNTMSKKSNKANTTAIVIKEGYEAKVIYEAVKRAGKNPHLKGHIHEILVKDGINYNLKNIISGKTAQIVKSPTAKTVDIIVKQNGKIIERLQLKDTPNSINSVIKQIKSGHYNSAKIVATDETAKELIKRAGQQGINKTIKSSGISTETTTRLAQKAGAKGSGTLMGAVGSATKSGAKFGGGVSAGIAVAGGVIDLINGDKDLAEVTADVIVEGTKGAITGGATAAVTTVAAPVITGAVSTAATVAAGTAIGSTAAGAAVIGATVAAAPVVAVGAIAVGIGSIISSIFDW